MSLLLTLNLVGRPATVNAAAAPPEETRNVPQSSRPAQNHRPTAVAAPLATTAGLSRCDQKTVPARAGLSYFFFAPAFLVDFFFVFLAAIYMAPCGDASSR